MDSFSDLLTALGPLQSVGDRFNVTAQAVSNMKKRNSVHSRYWPAIVALAAEQRIDGITLSLLLDLDRRRHRVADAPRPDTPTLAPEAPDENDNPAAENLSGEVAA